ncbi:hypothetical protein HELRODRAFT_123655, partial [Helobdella robusta]|uniref:Carboxylesterase type B domain-containing protein n=1 Tax=Helobdella robusta TaxID=6412 RepID=T1EGY4_HELRO
SLPVLLFIHGSSYDFGTGNMFDGRILAAYGLVIVVTINYRLGVLGWLVGFLSTTDSDASGNYALLDQVAALQWIQANIKNFGGNPNGVTIMGQGHGAAMANMLMMSPITRGSNLFQRVILLSGSAFSVWAI